MTQYLVTPKLRAKLKESLHKLADRDTLSHHELIAWYKECKPCPSMLGLMRLTKMDVPNKTIRNESLPKTKEYLKSMERLKLIEKEEEYRRLVNPRPALGLLYEDKFDEPYNPAQAHKETRTHITTMFNILISVVSVVYAIWYWTDTSWGLRDSYRILLCLFFGILILVAEVVVYMGYLNKIEEARIKERKKKEVKKVIRTVKLS